MKLDFSDLYMALTSLGKGPLAMQLDQHVKDALEKLNHGDYDRWQAAIDAMPELMPMMKKLDSPTVVIGTPANITKTEQDELRDNLMQLHPWRKGPFQIFGLDINTEWRSDWKWGRLQGHIKPLRGKVVLDVGCGSGYHVLRMLGDGAAAVVGLEPTLVYVMQFQALNQYIDARNAAVLPLTIEDVTGTGEHFDTVFSMGLLYHRRDPQQHIAELRDLLKPGGELVLETLIIESDKPEMLVPEDRYCRMRNVHNLPSVPLIEQWLAEAGLKDIRCVDVSHTSTQEQRSTEWMTFESLDKCLDPKCSTKTIEGLPGPIRAMFVCEK